MPLVVLSLPPPITLARASPWQPRTPPLHRPTPSEHRPHAKARGFGQAAATLPEKKETQDSRSSSEGDSKSDDDEIPQVVYDRMIPRVVVASATPIALGVGVLGLLGLLKEKGVWEPPVWLSLVAAVALFGTSGLGLVYGTLSTSMDPEKKGSFWGWEEAKRNWPELWKEDKKQSS